MSILFQTIWVYILLYNNDLILIVLCDLWPHIEVNLPFLRQYNYSDEILKSSLINVDSPTKPELVPVVRL